MQDDFDSGMGIPDDELAGESAMSEGDALGGHDGDVELEAPESEPVGRASGGARAMSSGGAKAARPGRRPAAKKAAPRRPPSGREEGASRQRRAQSLPRRPPRKAAKKGARRRRPSRKAAPSVRPARRNKTGRGSDVSRWSSVAVRLTTADGFPVFFLRGAMALRESIPDAHHC